jgi:biotin transporter BioY
MAINWRLFAAAALVAVLLLLWMGAPLVPVLAGGAGAALWNLRRHRAC